MHALVCLTSGFGCLAVVRHKSVQLPYARAASPCVAMFLGGPGLRKGMAYTVGVCKDTFASRFAADASDTSCGCRLDRCWEVWGIACVSKVYHAVPALLE